MSVRLLAWLAIGGIIASALWSLPTLGHRLLPLLLLLIALGSLCYYLGFVHTGPNPFRFLAQSAAVTLLSLALLVGYVSWLDGAGLEKIGQIIRPYPGIEDISFLPPIADDQIQLWLVQSHDPAAEVSSFYQQLDNRLGWKMVAPPPMMVLERQSQRLSVFIRDNRVGGSDIVYDLRWAP